MNIFAPVSCRMRSASRQAEVLIWPYPKKSKNSGIDFLKILLEACQPYLNGPDPEVSLEALIEASQMLQKHLERELDELRQEQAE